MKKTIDLFKLILVSFLNLLSAIGAGIVAGALSAKVHALVVIKINPGLCPVANNIL